MNNHILFPIACELHRIRKCLHSGHWSDEFLLKFRLIFSDYSALHEKLDFSFSTTSFLHQVIQILLLHIRELLALKVKFRRGLNTQVNQFEASINDVVRSLSSIRVESRSTSQIVSDGKSRRLNYPKNVINTLKGWLEENSDNPYPTEAEKHLLSEKTGLNMTQINNWFINARRRLLPYLSK
jgi:hypothetical protein